ncbi:MAG TPA: class I SAM-dependent methyltransferase [Candidatus Moranbacteria bacterium]|nr:class I SAM-dependent methyltransferase [Candidatus Moranbacteria bacterium]
MEFTGERMMPEVNKGGVTYIEHMARYLFASRFVKNKYVLDIACGSGYGSKMISEAGAEKVFGVDISEEAILHCQENFNDKKIDFIRGSVSKIPVSDNSVDIVVSFETIEHVDKKNQHDFLKEVKRVLKDKGVFIVSTPNSLVYPKGNKFHIHEMNPQEFRQIINENFKKSEMFYQDDVAASYIMSENGAKERSVIEFIDANIFKKSEYIIAVCSDDNIENTFNFAGLTEWKPYKSISNEIQQKNEIIQQKEKEIDAMRKTKAWRLAVLYVYVINKIKSVLFSSK